MRAGVRRVIAAMRDPDPRTAGRGFARLRKAGIRVEVGLRRREAAELNRVFIKRIATGLPYVVCKAAVSLDGKIACATGASRWITGLPARRHAHALRGLADAIVVGSGTLRQDDPELTVRLAPGRRPHPPWRVVLAGRRPLPAKARIFRRDAGARLVVAYAAPNGPPPGLDAGTETWALPAEPDGRVDTTALVERLGREGACFVLVEGGAEVHASFLGLSRRGAPVLADEVQWIVAPRILGGRDAPGAVGGAGAGTPAQGLAVSVMETRVLGPDRLIRGRLLDAGAGRTASRGGNRCSRD